MSDPRHKLLMLLFSVIAVLTAGCGQGGTAQGVGETPAEFEVDGEVATMAGVIDSSTPDAVQTLVEQYPAVTVIALVDVPGSVDDEANIAAARLVRSYGLNTHVPAHGEIASGGVDFFLAGATRTFDDGARFGVHSWATGDGVQGIDVPVEDAQHRLYLDFYDSVDIAESFYWFTLEAAPAEDIHWMTPAELATHGFASAETAVAGNDG